MCISHSLCLMMFISYLRDIILSRAAQWSLQELERKYNVALEKQAMLENEVVAKTALAEEVQRLKDELRGTNTQDNRLTTEFYFRCRSYQERIGISVKLGQKHSLSFVFLMFIDTNVELAVMKSNQATLNTSTASLSSYGGSTSSLADRKPTAAGSNEAMPAIRARLAKSGAILRASGATRPSGSGPGSTPGLGTPHQNPVLMVQEMVGRVKVTCVYICCGSFSFIVHQ